MRTNNYRIISDIFTMPDKEKERYKGMDEKIEEYRDTNGIKTSGEMLFEYLNKNRNYRSYCFPMWRLPKTKDEYKLIVSKVIIEWKTAMKNNCFRLYDIGEFVWKM